MIISDGKRLAYYQARADVKFWNGHWKEQVGKTRWLAGEHGELGWFEEPFVKYLPKAGKIIEAGCGLGYYVVALAARGYDVEGVEWSKEAVGFFKQRYPKLKVTTGDVRKLAVKNGYYSGYISLGVIEHSRSGPAEYLQEANRILKAGGVALISVPHFNLLRRIKSVLGLYRGDPSGLDFYQYAFTEAEIDRIIEKAGFKVIDHFRYDAYKGIKDELPFLRNLLSLLSLRRISSSSSRLSLSETNVLSFRAEGLSVSRRRRGNPEQRDVPSLSRDLHEIPFIPGILRPPTADSGRRNVGFPRDVPSGTSLGMTFKRPWWLKLAERYCGHMTMVICEKLI